MAKKSSRWAAGLFAFVALIICARFTFATMHYVPSGSMLPTLPIGHTVIVNSLEYMNGGEPERGDIVVFAPPENWAEDHLMIKRIVGLPGEIIGCSLDQQITINGERLIEDYTLEREHCRPFPPQEVPEGHYWVMGDNRLDSRDSSTPGQAPDTLNGPVPYENIEGKQWGSIPFSINSLLSHPR